jgi:hypothetical protein
MSHHYEQSGDQDMESFLIVGDKTELLVTLHS